LPGRTSDSSAEAHRTYLDAPNLVQPTRTPAALGLAQCYFRLAEQAEQNHRADVWAEFGPKPKVGGREEGEAGR
jgi:hypothetical protein